MKTLRLILGDQLNYKHSWLHHIDEEVMYVMTEMLQETNYVNHHIQKVVGFFSSMRNFYEHFKNLGHQFTYYEIDDENNPQKLKKIIQQLIKTHSIQKFEYQLPDEYRLDKELKEICASLTIETNVTSTEHFLTSRTDLKDFYKGKKEMVMEYFYRHMRKKYDILMETNKKPEGGKWDFDKSNRKKWTAETEIPKEKSFRKDVSSIVTQIQNMSIKTIGNIDEKKFSWPTSREDSLKVLRYFCDNLLVHFGDFQDAMHTDEKFLYHSRLSFALNTKMLAPKEVIDAAVNSYYEKKDEIDISQIEGFVRQILGWREYMRGIYWKEMPNYATKNKLNNKNELPNFYWTANTKMNCLKKSIQQSLDDAYAHHIQRLMITGNFALLTQTDPKLVDDWYLGIYIDAIQWVEMPNTRGMSQFADGGIVATKPYVSSGSYINKMSNYCKDCFYSVHTKTKENSCPFNSLYWNFLSEKHEILKDNHRMNMIWSVYHKMDKETLTKHKEKAKKILENINEY